MPQCIPLKMIAALCTFLALWAAPTLGQDSQVLALVSPCPTVFTYDPPGPEQGLWSGVVNLSTDYLLHSLWLDIVLDGQALKLLHRMADVTTENFKNFRIQNEGMQLKPGIPTSLPFSVQYDTNDEVPRLQAIRLNGIVICNAPLAEGKTDSKLKTNVNFNKKPVIKSSKLVINPVSHTPPDPGNIANAGDDFSGHREKTQCGKSTLVSQWPWVAALYKIDATHGYDCGGTLVSHLHVITAAKCVHVGKSSEKPLIDKKTLVVHLGKNDLSSVVGVQIRLVQKMIVSPDFVDSELTYNGLDAAILVLQEPVTYTDWVRPVCLWPADQADLDNAIGKKGWLVGWGYDEKNEVVEQLSQLEIPVIAQDTCFKSEGYAQYNITEADNCYCAGDGKGTGLCKGVDTGNGMVFKIGDAWHIRGHVTFYVEKTLKGKVICDPTGYIQFAHIAKSISWIHDIVSYYV